jgi:uncharacterized protein YjbJ (UPF0337 family)
MPRGQPAVCCVHFRTERSEIHGYPLVSWASTHARQNKGGTLNDDQVNGRIEEAKGSIKKAAGNAVGNRVLARKGKIQKAQGKAQADFGDLREEIDKSNLAK